jgi:hypothetical protein
MSFMKSSYFLTILAGFVLSSAPSQAACYSKDQAEADQGIRIHSELMVIGLNCQHMGMRQGENLYMTYRNFTNQYNELFAGYEETLLQFYKQRGDAKPLDSLNTLRTLYANKISKDAAGMRPDIFCSNYAPRISKAAVMSRDELKSWAATIFPTHPVSYPLCDAAG